MQITFRIGFRSAFISSDSDLTTHSPTICPECFHFLISCWAHDNPVECTCKLDVVELHIIAFLVRFKNRFNTLLLLIWEIGEIDIHFMLKLRLSTGNSRHFAHSVERSIETVMRISVKWNHLRAVIMEGAAKIELNAFLGGCACCIREYNYPNKPSAACHGISCWNSLQINIKSVGVN